MSTLGSILSNATTSLAAAQLELSGGIEQHRECEHSGLFPRAGQFGGRACPAERRHSSRRFGRQRRGRSGAQRSTDQQPFEPGNVTEIGGRRASKHVAGHRRYVQRYSEYRRQATDTGLSAAITNFFNSFQTLSTNPSSPDARQAVVSDAQTMTNGVLSRSNSLRDDQNVANQTVATDVQQIKLADRPDCRCH